MNTTTINPRRPLASDMQTAAQYSRAASDLRFAAHELEALSGLPDIENQAYWEWDQHQPPSQPLHLPLQFTCWTLLREAELLEARARVMRGGER